MRESSVISDPTVAERALFLLLEAGQLSDAVDLMGFAVRGGTDEVGWIVTYRGLSWARTADTSARECIVDGLLRFAAETGEPDQNRRAAQLTYNAAQLVRRDDWDHALVLLRRAGDLDPTYRARGYWWREQGGLLFLLGRHEQAAEAYSEAVARGENEARPLLADALLWSRKPDQAIELFAQVALEPSLSTPEWRLKARVLPTVQDHLVGSGLRSPSDLLDAQVLHELATASTTPAMVRLALVIAAALASETAPELWLQAMALSVEDGGLFEDVALTARRFCGDEIVDCMLEGGLGAEAAHELLELFERLPPDRPARNVLRFMAPGSDEIEVIDLNDPPF